MASTSDDAMIRYIGEVLPSIDRLLAAKEVPLNHRPFHAAVEFMETCVIAVREPDGIQRAPGEIRDYAVTRSFAAIYAQVDAWYRDRFGAAIDRDTEKTILGVVEIAGTPFALRVPTVRCRPGIPGETIKISFPDGVREGEDPTTWVEAGPNIDRLPADEQLRARGEATQVADRLRYIRTSLIAVGDGDDRLSGLIAGILPRLESAASLLLKPEAAAVQQAYWELQLACEHALKALVQQQRGAFRESHDLFRLYDDADPLPQFDRQLLGRLPSWRESSNMRYGQGPHRPRRGGIEAYRSTLQIIAGSLAAMRKWGIGYAEFEIKRPPWFAVIDEAARSSAKDEHSILPS